MRRIAQSPVAWLIVIVIAASALNLWAQHRSERNSAANADKVVFQNQINACVQGNPAREQTVFVYSTAAIHAPAAQEREANRLALRVIVAQPFIEANGRKQCYLAIEEP